MAYSTQADVINQLPEEHVGHLTNDTDGNSINSTVLSSAIEFADSLIDSYLRGKHSVPFTTAPPLIKHISVDLAVWRLYSRRNIPWLDEDTSYNYIRKEAIKQLEEIRKGVILIDTPDDTPNTGKLYFVSKKNKAEKKLKSKDLDKFFDGVC